MKTETSASISFDEPKCLVDLFSRCLVEKNVLGLSIEEMKDYFDAQGSLQILLGCPIATTFFIKFLELEKSIENLNCYYEVRTLLDLNDYCRQSTLQLNGQNLNSCEDGNDSVQVLKGKRSFYKSSVQSGSDWEKSLVEHITQFLKEGQNFIRNYIDTSSAISEVNVDENLKLPIKKSFSNLLANFQEERSSKINALRHIEQEKFKQLDQALQNLQTQLLYNMNDSLSRFKKSKLWEDALQKLLETGDNSYNKDKFTHQFRCNMVLNDHIEWLVSSRSPLTTASDLLNSLIDILKDGSLWYWDNKLNRIVFNYSQLSIRVLYTPWKRWIDRTSELSKVDLSLLKTNEEKITFWINIFNLIYIHAAIVNQGVPRTKISRDLFYKNAKYNIGDNIYSLEDIHDIILFGNIHSNFIFGARFRKKDPRAIHCIETPNPLAFFALTDLSFHSPQLEIIDIDHMQEQLERLTTNYLDKCISIEDNVVIVPRLLLDKKKLFLQFLHDNDIRMKASEQSLCHFIKQYASHFKQKDHNNDHIQFRNVGLIGTNVACVLNEQDLKILEEKKKSEKDTNGLNNGQVQNFESCLSTEFHHQTMRQAQKCSIM
jgi:hypothetical protein